MVEEDAELVEVAVTPKVTWISFDDDEDYNDDNDDDNDDGNNDGNADDNDDGNDGDNDGDDSHWLARLKSTLKVRSRL